jgi:hypothetical protein
VKRALEVRDDGLIRAANETTNNSWYIMKKTTSKIVEIDKLSKDIFRSEKAQLPVWINLIQPVGKNAYTQMYVERLANILNRLFQASEITTESRAYIRWNNQRFHLSPNNVVLKLGYSPEGLGSDTVRVMTWDFATNPDAFKSH